MKTIRKQCWMLILLLAAAAVRADSYSLTNTIAPTPGDPPIALAFDLAQFNPANGTLSDVSLTISGLAITEFHWSAAPGALMKFWQSNALTVVYHGSNLAEKTFIFQSPAYPTAIGGSGVKLSGNSLSSQQFLFTSADDLFNFTGTGTVPLGAEYFVMPVLTTFNGAVTTTLTNTASFTAIVSYDFTPVPEPASECLLVLGGLVWWLRRGGRKLRLSRSRSDNGN